MAGAGALDANVASAVDAIEQCKHDWMRDALRTWASTMPGLETAG